MRAIIKFNFKTPAQFVTYFFKKLRGEASAYTFLFEIGAALAAMSSFLCALFLKKYVTNCARSYKPSVFQIFVYIEIEMEKIHHPPHNKVPGETKVPQKEFILNKDLTKLPIRELLDLKSRQLKLLENK